MADAWDELRERLGPKGCQAAQALLDRLRANEGHRQWECSLHLEGVNGRPRLFWVEPIVRTPLTNSADRPHSSDDVA